jgi:CubicO group peptidase (beta-lactamase class C family)
MRVGWWMGGLACATMLLAGGRATTTPNQPSAGAAGIDSMVDLAVRAEALSRGVPGVAIAIVADGEVVVQRGYGWADPQSGTAVNAATPFNIASVTKPFTSLLAVRLIEQGRLQLDDSIGEHLPWLPPRYRSITVRQLLGHTSGIARDLRLDNADDPDADTYRARLDTAAASAPPGERWEYSNTGYTVLGWVLEAAGGASLGELYQREIFAPLDMWHTRYRAPIDADPRRARPHAVVDGRASPVAALTGGFASGGLSMSAVDLARFGLALQQGDLLTSPSWATTWSSADLADGTPVATRMFGAPAGYGFGWFLASYHDERLMTHGGGIEGYSANLYHFPDRRLTIAVLANSKDRDDGRAPVDTLARRIANGCLAMDDCRLGADERQRRRAIAAANTRFSAAYVAGDTTALAAMYHPAAIALTGAGLALGDQRSIAGLFRRPTSSTRTRHALYAERFLSSERTLVEQGTWYDESRRGDSVQAGSGRYVLTWLRGDGGEWLVAADAWQ